MPSWHIGRRLVRLLAAATIVTASHSLFRGGPHALFASEEAAPECSYTDPQYGCISTNGWFYFRKQCGIGYSNVCNTCEANPTSDCYTPTNSHYMHGWEEY